MYSTKKRKLNNKNFIVEKNYTLLIYNEFLHINYIHLLYYNINIQMKYRTSDKYDINLEENKDEELFASLKPELLMGSPKMRKQGPIVSED